MKNITGDHLLKAIRYNAPRDIEDRHICIGQTLQGELTSTYLASFLIGGQTQQGKSVIASFFAMWFVMAGSQIVLLDPHMHNRKRGLYTKLEPLGAWFARPPIDCLDIDEILEVIDWLEAEYKQRKRSMTGKAPLLLVIDEFNELLSSGFTKKQGEHVSKVLGNVGRGGAKHGLFLLCVGHNFDLASAGGNAVRRNILGRVSVSAEIGEMSNILDVSDRTRIRQLASTPTPLKPGQALVKVPGYGLYRLNYPMITPEYLADFAIFMRKNSLLVDIPVHKSIDTPEPLIINVPNSVPIYAPPINVPMNATNESINPHKSNINLHKSTEKGIQVTQEEQTAIEAAASVQLRLTGGVNRTQLRRDLGWEKRYKAYEKIKAVCDAHDWRLPSKQDKLTPEQREALLEQAGYQCVQCGSPDNLTIDHIIPRVKGGGNDPSNLQVLCKVCNSSKGIQSA